MSTVNEKVLLEIEFDNKTYLNVRKRALQEVHEENKTLKDIF